MAQYRSGQPKLVNAITAGALIGGVTSGSWEGALSGGLTGAIASQIPQIPDVTSMAGTIGPITPQMSIASAMAQTKFYQLAASGITLNPLSRNMTDIGNVAAPFLSYSNPSRIFGGTSQSSFLDYYNIYSTSSVIVTAAVEKALGGDPSDLDSTTSYVAQISSSAAAMAGIIQGNSGYLNRVSGGQQLLSSVGIFNDLSRSTAVYSSSASGLVTATYTNPLNLHLSMAGSLAGTILGGSGSTMGAIQGYTTPDKTTNISVEALVNIGYGNRAVWESYDRQPSAVNDPAFWTGRKPFDNPSLPGIYTMKDFLISKEAKNEVQYRSRRLNFNRMASHGLLDPTMSADLLNGYLNVGHYNLADAYAARGGSTSINQYGFNLQSLLAVGASSVANLLMGGQLNAAIPGSGMGGFTVGNLLNSPHMLSSNMFRYVNSPDTNRLAVGIDQYGDTIHNRIDSTIDTVITTATGQTWGMPESTHNSIYPMNRVRSGQAGLVEEFDNTPGAPRWHIFHPSGSRIEIDNAGVKIENLATDSYVYVGGNNKVNIRGSLDVTIESSANILVKNKLNLVAYGDVTADVRNDVNLTVSGGLNANVKEAFRVKAKQINLETDNMSVNVKEVLSEKAQNRFIKTESLDVKVDDNYSETSVKRSVNATEFTSKTSGETSFRGSAVNINGGPLNPTATKESEITSLKLIDLQKFKDDGEIEARAYPSDVPLVEPYRNTKQDRDAFDNESASAGSGGSAGSGEGGGVPPGYNIETPPGNGLTGDIVDGSEFKGIIRGNELGDKVYAMRLSENFLVRHFTRDIPNGLGHYLEPVNFGGRMVSVEEILTNLKATAVNIMEPIFAKYSNAILISSGWRNQRYVDNKGSQHCLGQAVDIQLRNVSRFNSRDYDNFRKDILTLVKGFDQCILERSTRGSHWVHISYSSSRNRGQVFNIAGASGSA